MDSWGLNTSAYSAAFANASNSAWANAYNKYINEKGICSYCNGYIDELGNFIHD